MPYTPIASKFATFRATGSLVTAGTLFDEKIQSGYKCFMLRNLSGDTINGFVDWSADGAVWSSADGTTFGSLGSAITKFVQFGYDVRPHWRVRIEANGTVIATTTLWVTW